MIRWSEVFINEKVNRLKNRKLNIPVVIMAGGKGERLAPFTRVFPKPLIPFRRKEQL